MITLQAALDLYLQSKAGVQSPATIDWYRRRLGSLLAYFGAEQSIESITVYELRAWRGELAGRSTRYAHHPNRGPVAGGLSRYTLQSYVRAARTFMRWLEDENLLNVSPARRLELPALPAEPRKGIAESDMLKIIEASRRDPRDYAICCLLADSGARVAGIAGLRLGDLELEAGRATVREKGRGGNSKARTIFMQSVTVRALRRWLAVRPDVPDCDRVFLSYRSRNHLAGLATESIHQILERLAKRVGVKSAWSPHQWRHAFARNLLQQGANLAHVSQLLGHAGVDVTVRHYGSLAVGELQDAHRRYALKLE